MEERGPRGEIDAIFEQLFAREVPSIDYAHHPPDELWQEFLQGRLRRSWPSPDEVMARLESGEPEGRPRSEELDRREAWDHHEAMAHLLTCHRCRDRVSALRVDALGGRTIGAELVKAGHAVRRLMHPVPRPAVATIAVQFALILGLAGLLLFRVVPSGSPPATPVAAVEDQGGTIPQPAEQAIHRLSEDPDPQSRLAAAEQLRKWSDPSLVEPLVGAYRRERHPEVRQAIERTLVSIWTGAEERYRSAAQAFREVGGSRDPASGVLERLNREMAQLFQEFNGPALDASEPVRLRCRGQPELTLDQLHRLRAEVGGRVVLEGSSPAGTFQLTLPAQGSVEIGGALRRLESELGISCRR